MFTYWVAYGVMEVEKQEEGQEVIQEEEGVQEEQSEGLYTDIQKTAPKQEVKGLGGVVHCLLPLVLVGGA